MTCHGEVFRILDPCARPCADGQSPYEVEQNKYKKQCIHLGLLRADGEHFLGG